MTRYVGKEWHKNLDASNAPDTLIGQNTIEFDANPNEIRKIDKIFKKLPPKMRQAILGKSNQNLIDRPGSTKGLKITYDPHTEGAYIDYANPVRTNKYENPELFIGYDSVDKGVLSHEMTHFLDLTTRQNKEGRYEVSGESKGTKGTDSYTGLGDILSKDVIGDISIDDIYSAKQELHKLLDDKNLSPDIKEQVYTVSDILLAIAVKNKYIRKQRDTLYLKNDDYSFPGSHPASYFLENGNVNKPDNINPETETLAEYGELFVYDYSSQGNGWGLRFMEERFPLLTDKAKAIFLRMLNAHARKYKKR